MYFVYNSPIRDLALFVFCIKTDGNIFCNVYNLMSPTTTTINDMKYENILHDLDPLLFKISNQSILNKAENMSYWHR